MIARPFVYNDWLLHASRKEAEIVRHTAQYITI